MAPDELQPERAREPSAALDTGFSASASDRGLSRKMRLVLSRELATRYSGFTLPKYFSSKELKVKEQLSAMLLRENSVPKHPRYIVPKIVSPVNPVSPSKKDSVPKPPSYTPPKPPPPKPKK